jgi:predicted phage terminase large subunit-like protein
MSLTAFKKRLATLESLLRLRLARVDLALYAMMQWPGFKLAPHHRKRMISLAQQWVPTQILVEDQASGQSLIQELKYQSALPITPVKVDRDKLARAQAITPLIEAGKVFLPRHASWVSEYVNELAAFPTGAHDDAVDSTTQALNYIRHQPRHSVTISTQYV